MTIPIPPELANAVDEDDLAERLEWLAGLPDVIEAIACDWGLELGEPYLPGGQCAWVAPAWDGGGNELALKVGWRHREAEHEADALRFWDGDDAVRCLSLGPAPAVAGDRPQAVHRRSRLRARAAHVQLRAAPR
ncbi:MAG TPA: hypothetical protein VGI50_06300 [Solirubrobacteraceae bacterium]